ncbi:hypothetical protein ACHAXN_004426 [Cyclotella atomus]
MEFNSSGQIQTLDQIRTTRRRNGYCESCRIDPVRCFEMKKGVLGIPKKTPLTVPNLVYNGICLHCHPHMAPVHTRRSEVNEEMMMQGMSGSGNTRRAEFVRQGGARDVHHVHHRTNGHHGHEDSNEEEEEEEIQMVEEQITNIMGETRTVLRPKKKKKKDRSKRRHPRIDEEYEFGDMHQPSCYVQDYDNAEIPRFFHRSSSYAERKAQEEDDDDLDVLGQMVAQHLAESNQAPTMNPDHFIPGAELALSEIEDDAITALTMPTVFADDGTVISRSTRSLRASARNLQEGVADNSNAMSPIRERKSTNSGSHSDGYRSVASHELREPAVPTQSEETYFQSTDELSPDIDFVRDVVRECMQINNDKQAIEVVRQALMDTESMDLALFCLTTLWVLVRKSDENKRHVLYGSRNEETRDDETPFGAIISAMVNFESAEIQTRACGVIWSLSMNPEDRKDVAQLGGCQAILQAMLMYTDDEPLQVMALGALKVLSFNVVGQSSLRQIDASSVVAASMSKHITNPTIQSEGSAIICNLATGPNHFIIPVTEEELDAIVNSILTHRDLSSVQEGAIFALMNLSSSTVNVEMMRQNPKLYEALDLSFTRHPDVVGRDIQVLLENLRSSRFSQVNKAR